MIEVHHVHAFELGGETTVENLALTCRGHNGFFADKDFGAAFMRMKRVSSIAAKRARRPG
jgi:5-methylcytosine-specific restriction endonuclease McrA